MDDIDPLLPIDEARFKVQVRVQAGEYHSVEYTALVEIDMTDPSKAVSKLRDVSQILRRGLPINELKSEDREHVKNGVELAIDKAGQMGHVPKGFSQSMSSLQKLKDEQSKEDLNGELPIRQS